MKPPQEELLEQLIDLATHPAQREAFTSLASTLTEADFNEFKAISYRYQASNLSKTLCIGQLLRAIGRISSNDYPRALGYSIRGNGYLLVGNFTRAIQHYDRAASLYGGLQRRGDQAHTQTGKIYALTQLGRYQEAEETVAWARPVMEEHENWVGLSRMVSNLGIMYSRLGDEERALAMFDQARVYCLKNEVTRDSFLPNIELNRALALRRLGRFDESIATSQRAREMLLESNYTVEATRALQATATTYFALGRYNEALALLDRVGREFEANDRTHDRMIVEVYISDSLLELRRFDEVLEKCPGLRQHFSAQEMPYELSQVVVNEAMAYIGLQHFERAEHLLEEALTIFQKMGSYEGVAYTGLLQAGLLHLSQRHSQSVVAALSCAARFVQQKKPIEAAQAHLIAARNFIALGQDEAALAEIRQVTTGSEQRLIPWLEYQLHHLLGTLAAKQGELTSALAEFDAAIESLENQRGRLMLEFRASYLEDKQAIYEDAVLLCLETARPAIAFDYSERAKSRALLDMLAGHISLKVRARTPQDQPLVDELLRLREQSDFLQRQWQDSEDQREAVFSTRGDDFAQARSNAAALERRITELWHLLLIRNADYAEDAALWRSRVEPIQPLLDEDTILLQYFVARGQWFLFLVTKDEIRAQRLTIEQEALSHLLHLLQMNMAAVPSASSPAHLASLESGVGKILRRLYDWLVRPVAWQVAGYRRVILVPHGPLHYLPFHALHTGQGYWVEQQEISYLPSASFLHYCRTSTSKRRRVATFGHSVNKRLPHAPMEANMIADVMDGRAFVEAAATKAEVYAQASEAEILHFATHADFRADNPLFCGLYLDDGPLTVLDIFDLKVQADLVTLSACQTGRSIVGGGDELLGLMRAWMAAGASSLLLTYWAVEDSSTAHFMRAYYERLAAGQGKAAALRLATLATLAGASPDSLVHSHPYFWAAFFLVGDSGKLGADL